MSCTQIYLNTRHNYNHFWKFKMAHALHIIFNTVDNSFALRVCYVAMLLTIYVTLGYWNSITIPNHVLKIWSTPNLCPKTKFKMSAAVILNLRAVAILKHCQLHAIHLNHHTKISGKYLKFSTNCWIIITFWNSRWQPSGILDFRKPDFLTNGSPLAAYFPSCTKFCAKMLIDACIMAQKQNSK